MKETAMEKARKDEAERDWEKYDVNSPTEGQKNYISTLARAVGLKVNLANIESRQKAARIIDQLKLAGAGAGTPAGCRRADPDDNGRGRTVPGSRDRSSRRRLSSCRQLCPTKRPDRKPRSRLYIVAI